MTEIQKFYSGKTVFVTGATGFLGKALVEKLLRSTKVERIYVMIREKSQMTIDQRLRELLKQSVFDELTKKSYPEHLLARLSPIGGNCELPDLGLSASDRDLLVQNVNVVFHCAATVRFTEPLRFAARINVAATQDLLKLARQMERLEAFIHVSTAFVGCTRSFIEEDQIFVPKTKEIGGGNALEALRRILLFDGREQAMLTTRILGDYPNTYTFTKTLAEEVVVAEVGQLPAAIFRPGIVGPAYGEPQPGWLEHALGIPSFIMGVLLGLIHTVKCSKTSTIAGIPIDYCVNAMIACGFRTANEKKRRRDTPVIYNMVAEKTNQTKWRDAIDMMIDLARKEPTSKLMWYPFLFVTESDFVVRLLQFLFHTMPAMVFDLMGSFKTKQKKSLHIVQRLHKMLMVVEYFLMRSWNVSTVNLRQLWSGLDDADQEIFPFDMLQVDWEHYNYNYAMGVRRLLIKEDPDMFDKGKNRYRILRVVNYFTLFIIMIFMFIAIRWLISLAVPRAYIFTGLSNSTMDYSMINGKTISH